MLDSISLGMAQSYLAKNKNAEFVFAARETGSWQTYNHYLVQGWHRLMDEAGFTDEIERDGKTLRVRKYTPYSLRHFFASVLIDQNKSPLYLQSVMGHENIKMTYDVYGHLLRKKELERSADRGGIIHTVREELCGEAVAEKH
ncbi:MAG: tyrosine-type recombinase/integrase [Phycisphaeraceae bacterium]|nr:tyrosine-type recombinase/integrase [Phycisphaeraceae bacterium]